jgi:hypothetical protein
MSDDNQFVLERLRLWRQIETLLSELQEHLYDWYDYQPELDDLRKRLLHSPPYHQQLLLPFINQYYAPDKPQNPCPLCLIRRWP